MKYVVCPEWALIDDALNFDRNGLYVVGGCDLYTTKAAGEDKKLYAEIENQLQQKHRELLSFAASLSAYTAVQFANSVNLDRQTPFGTFNKQSNRRAFAYLLCTLNAAHPDYNFKRALPEDFHRERHLEAVTRDVDEKILSAHGRSMFGRSGSHTPGGSSMWTPDMWRRINNEMDLEDCQIYSYDPEVNPFEEDEPCSPTWSFHYFFYNRRQKRVCYIYARAVKISSYTYSDDSFATPKRTFSARSSADFSGAAKRARYWLGDRADDLDDEYAEADQVIKGPGDDEVDVDIDPDELDDLVRNGRCLSPASSFTMSHHNDSEDDDCNPASVSPKRKSKSEVETADS